MEPLTAQLVARGLVDQPTVDWARAQAHEHGMSVETALLSLDAIGEEELLGALGAHFGLAPLTPADLAGVQPDTLQRFPEGFSRSFRLCPLRLDGERLSVLVEQPLAGESLVEMRELFGVEVDQHVATGHHRALAWARVYGGELDPPTRELEGRLARRRRARGVASVLAEIGTQPSLGAAMRDIVDFAATYFDVACFLVGRGGSLRVAAAGGRELSREPMPMPEPGSSIGMAVRHGAYFMGPVAGTPADQIFYAALGHERPAWAFVAPVPASAQSTIVLYADNGPRVIAKRWVAEVSLLVARLAQAGGAPGTAGQTAAESDDDDEVINLPVSPPGATEPPPPGTVPPPPITVRPPPMPPGAAPEPLSEDERTALATLRAVAEQEGTTLTALVESLFAQRHAHAVQGSAAIAGEVSGLFEKLAADIPAQLARGMENAFRELVPRIAQMPMAAAPAAAPAAVAAAPPASPAASAALLVKKEAGPREVPSYRSRRKKVARVKL